MDTKMKIGLGVMMVFVLAFAITGGIIIFGGQDTVYVETGTQVFTTEFGTQHNALIYNNTELVDHRYLITQERCEGYNLGMNISIYPCVSHTFGATDISSFVDFTWQGGSAQNTSWVFVYEGDLESGQMLLARETEETYTGTVYEEQYVSNHVIHNVQSFTDISPPTVEGCDLGTENNTFMYDVIQDYGNHTTSTNYCFSQVTPINSTAYSLSGNASIGHQEQLTRNVTVYDVPVTVEYMGKDLLGNGFSYYKVQDVTFQPDQTYKTKWIYTPQGEAGSGKWHIFGYNSDLELHEAVDFGQYIYIDPEWTADLNVGIQAYWTFNETSGNIIDLVAGEHNGTASGSPTYQEQGVINGSIRVSSATTDYFDTASPSIWGGTNNMSIAYWLKIVDWSTQNYLLNGNDGGDAGSGWRIASINSGSATLSVNPTGSGMECGGGNNVANLASGTWYHVVHTWDDGETKTYIDGVQNLSKSCGFTTLDTVTTMKFGSSGTHNPNVVFDEAAVWNRTLSQAEITQLYNGGSGITYTASFTPPSTLNAYLVSPADSLLTLDPDIDFFSNQTAGGLVNNTNATLFVWNSTSDIINQTTYTLSGNGTAFASWNGTTYADGAYDWNVFACGTNGTAVCEYAVNGNFSFEVDTNAPLLVLEENLTDIFVESTDFPQNITLNYTVIDDHPDSCFVFTSDDDTNQTFACNTLYNVSFNNGGSKTVFYGANDTLGFITTANTTVDIGTYTASVDQDPIAEGGEATFSLALNKTGIGLEDLNATLVYNNTLYPYSTLSIVNDDYVSITRDLIIPDGTGSSSGNLIDWLWNFTASDSGNFTTTTQQQTVFSLVIDDCSAYGDQILNMTHYDEGTRELINTTAGNSIELDLEIASLNDGSLTWEYSNTWTDEASAVVCIPSGILNTTSYRIDFVAEYTATDHVTEFYYLDNGTLDDTESFNSLTNHTISLYDLALDDSTTFLFSFLDEDNLEVPNAIVHVFRQYIGSGIFEEVERAKQDDNGETHVHLVEEDVIYYFVISRDSNILFTSSTYNAKCLSTPCSIELEASPDFEEFPTDWDLLPNGTFFVSDNPTTRTVYLAFASSQSTNMNLTVAKQDYQGDITVVGTTSSTATSGNLSVVVPASAGNVTYYAIVYKDGEYIAHSVVDFTQTVTNYGGTGNFMGFILIVGLVLMGATEGVLFFVFLIFALILVAALALFEFSYYAVIGFICAMGILLYKLIKRGRTYR